MLILFAFLPMRCRWRRGRGIERLGTVTVLGRAGLFRLPPATIASILKRQPFAAVFARKLSLLRLPRTLAASIRVPFSRNALRSLLDLLLFASSETALATVCACGRYGLLVAAATSCAAASAPPPPASASLVAVLLVSVGSCTG